MYLANYLGMLRGAERDLAEGFRQMAGGHGGEPDVYSICHILAGQCDEHAEELEPFAGRYGEVPPEEPDRLGPKILEAPREGGLALLRDLQDIYVMAGFCEVTWTMILQAAMGARDAELLEVATACKGETSMQIKWVETRMKQAAPQVLIVAS